MFLCYYLIHCVEVECIQKVKAIEHKKSAKNRTIKNEDGTENRSGDGSQSSTGWELHDDR